jgi:methionyl-tRNA formyltransferase
MNNKERVVMATIKSWNLKNAHKFRETYKDKYDTGIVDNPKDLTVEKLKEINPQYIFFPHWSWIIPKEIYNNFECIVFHMTDLPYGRGGSPLQNLIAKKIYNTKISAIRVEGSIDTGKIYMKEPLYIGTGSAEEIFIRASEIIFAKMIPYILEHKTIPVEQTGHETSFKRRTSDQSNIEKANIKNIDDMYDFIRMLDAEGYPRAYIKMGNLKILFSDVHRDSDDLTGRFEIIEER